MRNPEHIVAIIQARNGSRRLPGKILMQIRGKPVLWHIINRLKLSRMINTVLVATTKNREDDITAEFCRRNRVVCYRGSNKDVLDRYYQAAKLYKANTIVRITADCPLIDPRVVDKVIRYYKKNYGRLDYVSNTLKRTYPRGLDTEIFSFIALEIAWKKSNKLYQREHVTPYIYEHPNIFRIAGIQNERNLSNMRWTIDEEKDFMFISEIYYRLYNEKEVFLMNDILRLLKKQPLLAKINNDVKQKRKTVIETFL